MTNTTAILRKGALAYIGLYGTAFERAQTRYTKVRTLRKSAQANFTDTLAKTYACGLARTRKVLPAMANTQVDVLEAEVTELAEKLAGLKKAAKKATPKAKKKTTAKKAPRHIAYLEKVRVYDASASEEIVKKIVNHCGISLSSRDGKFVACTDEAERFTVRDSWLKKKLNLEGTDAELDAKVLDVCNIMKADRLKSRVTFYYLLAKAEGKLASL